MQIQRTIFTDEHEIFRATVRRFLETEIQPHYARWEKAGIVDREAWLKAGAAGLLCTTMPPEYGGSGADRLFAAILIEEINYLGLYGVFYSLHSDIVAPYIDVYGTEAQKRRYLPKMASGEWVSAIAMTEPSGGSDLQAMRATAIRDGDHYVINGQKTFISNGHTADIFIVAAKTDPGGRAKGVSLFIVDGDTPGLERGRRLDKVGLHAQDTSELFFHDMRVPAANLLGREGGGFGILMAELAWERMQVGIGSIALCEAALKWTIDYTKDRTAFGKRIFDFQNTSFKLAELATEVAIGRTFIDKCLELVNERKLDPTTAAMVKYWTSDLTQRLLDQCVQFHGGYGFITDYPIARAWSDYRFQPIAAGSNEIMKDLIARSL